MKPNHAKRMTDHVLAQLVCLGTHTVTGLLAVCGRQFQDWSADYRMYERERVVPEHLFEPVRQWLCDNQDGPVVTAMDDTGLRRAGRKVYGAKYMRDPMGPPFRVNLMWAQRFVQTSMACKSPCGQATMIPVDWVHAPMPAKPKANAGEEAWKQYGEEREKASLSAVGAQRIRHLRQWLDEHGARQRQLWTVVDGSFTNSTVLKNLPENTVLVGRIRADAKLYHLPEQQPSRGRRCSYGVQAPTPEQLRSDDAAPWQTVSVYYGGKRRKLRVKKLAPLRSRTAGEHQTLQLLVIAPTKYRLSKNSKVLYRKPAYIICTDPDAPIKQVVQHYLWRWDIEVNHRDEKTLLGVGEAQVRTPQAVQNQTGCAVAAYAMLLTAAAKCRKEGHDCNHLPLPKWRKRKPQRITTMTLINNVRYELWARSIHFSGFMTNNRQNVKPEKTIYSPKSALFYANRYS